MDFIRHPFHHKIVYIVGAVKERHAVWERGKKRFHKCKVESFSVWKRQLQLSAVVKQLTVRRAHWWPITLRMQHKTKAISALLNRCGLFSSSIKLTICSLKQVKIISSHFCEVMNGTKLKVGSTDSSDKQYLLNNDWELFSLWCLLKVVRSKFLRQPTLMII